MAQQVKELVTAATPDTAVAWVQPWPGNLSMLWVQPKKNKTYVNSLVLHPQQTN